MDLFDRLVDNGATVIVVEHNLALVSRADYVIEFGPGQAPRVGRWWPRTRASKRGITFPTQAICSGVTGLCNVSTRASDSVKALEQARNKRIWPCGAVG